MYNEIEDMKDKAKKDKQPVDQQLAPAEDGEAEDSSPLPSALQPDFSKGPVAPKYEIVYTYPVSLGQFRNIENINEPKEKEMPTEMKIRIQIPHAAELDKIKCDFKESTLVFEYENIYYLEIHLMYIVDSDNAEAKFVSSKKQLEVKVKILSKLLIDEVEQSAPANRSAAIDDTCEDASQPTLSDRQSEPQVEAGEHTEEDRSHEAIEEVTPIGSSEQPPPTVEGEKPVDRLEVNFMLVPQSTYLDDAHIHLIHLRDYQAAAIDIVEDGSSVVLRWRTDAGNRYFYLTLGEAPIDRVEKRFIRDYVSIIVPFSSADASSRAKAATKIVTDENYEAVEAIYQKLASLRLTREQPSITEVQESPTEVLPPTEETAVEAQTAEPLEAGPTEDPATDSPSVDRSMGFQLLGLKILTLACELD